jgi:hypothetical protein
MKFALALIFIALIFVPSVAFGWKAPYNQDATCNIHCGHPYATIDHSSPFNFVLLGAISTIGLGVYYKISHTGKYEVFRLNCKTCGRKTNGLKCPYCEAEKQRI